MFANYLIGDSAIIIKPIYGYQSGDIVIIEKVITLYLTKESIYFIRSAHTNLLCGVLDREIKQVPANNLSNWDDCIWQPNHSKHE